MLQDHQLYIAILDEKNDALQPFSSGYMTIFVIF